MNDWETVSSALWPHGRMPPTIRAGPRWCVPGLCQAHSGVEATFGEGKGVMFKNALPQNSQVLLLAF